MVRSCWLALDKQGLFGNNPDFRVKEVAIKNLLRGCGLHTAREPRPGTRGINGVRDPLPFRSEPNNLLEDSLPFLIHSPTGLENNGSEVVIRVLKGAR